MRKETKFKPPKPSPKEISAKIRADTERRREEILQRIRAQNERTKRALKEQKRVIRLSASRLHKAGKFLTSKPFIYVLMVMMQLAGLVGLFYWALMPLMDTVIYLVAVNCIGLVFCVYVINSKISNEYKIIWVLVIMFFTIVGILLYLLLRKKTSKRRNKRDTERAADISGRAGQDAALLSKAEAEDPFIRSIAGIINAGSNLPVGTAEECEYFKSGEEYFERVLYELAQAQKFIFIESFIISEGSLWNEIFEILKAKAGAGADVRIIYDDLGCISAIPLKFGRRCVDAGIKLYCFNRLRPFLDAAQNNRTHRKMIIIDGKCAFTGGLNIADEYVNRKAKHGHWKDTGVMIKGGAVRNFTLMFLSSWLRHFGKEDIAPFIPDDAADSGRRAFCIPFCDTPLDRRTVCEDVYLKIISNAKNYVYINTPYFIVDDRMTAALISAAESGVDVRITVPHIPDKRTVFALTRAFYTPLVMTGIKVYEYKPGFIHAKSVVSDDKYSVIGSSNMDFRSLYLHYECNVFVYKEIAGAMREDYERTCEKSILITPEQAAAVPFLKRIGRSFLRILAPLL